LNHYIAAPGLDTRSGIIAQAFGYTLTHTFRVACKKIQGVSPLEWKKCRQFNVGDEQTRQ